jgi:Flp pilus assembly protein TadG
MRFRRDESGQMIVMLAISMTALMAFMALAVDVGILFHVRREVQIAADAAAMAGALDYHYNPTGSTARAAAIAAAAQNGVSNGSVNVTFPTSSSYGSPYTTGFVQAIVSVPNPTMFMRLFGMTSVNLVSSAVAGPGASQGCVWSLGRSGTGVSGSGDLTATGCEIYDNSSSGTALDMTGGGSISAKQVGVTGGSIGSVNPRAITGMIPVTDPLASLTAPGGSSGTCTPAASRRCNPSNTSGGSMNVPPGTYTSISNSGGGTMTLAGSYTITGNLSNTRGNLILGAGSYTIGGTLSNSGSLNLSAGQYVVEGGLQSSGSVTGNSVSFYTGGTTTLSGGVDLTAPASGILIFQAGGTVTILETGNMTLQGIVYAPNAPLTVGGSGSSNVYADFVVGSLNITGTPQLQNYALLNHGTPLTKIVMVQ